MSPQRKKPRNNKRTNDEWCRSLADQTIGKYVLKEFVGSGKIGYVYRASHKNIHGVSRAVKLIFDELRDGWMVELQKVMQLELVSGVVHFHEVGTEDLTHQDTTRLCQFTIWDYIPPGENLKVYLSRVGQVNTSFLLAVVERILHVLVACEEKGVPRHGDLHSGNILIGRPSDATLDDSLERRAPIYISDFGYGATGAATLPKDDYTGLGQIINEIIRHINYSTSTVTDRQILQSLQSSLGKLLNEAIESERQPPLEILRIVKTLKQKAQTHTNSDHSEKHIPSSGSDLNFTQGSSSVGQFQVSEMIGERWDWWRDLFVPTVPARSKILSLNIPTVVTGPRGCGKTMLFRRLSERLIVECGPVNELGTLKDYAALYVNANDYADAFSHFPDKPNSQDESLICCYANLSILVELLAIESARVGKLQKQTSDGLLDSVSRLIFPEAQIPLVEGEDRLERCRSTLERIKWRFPNEINSDVLPGYSELSQFRWLPEFMQQAQALCPWLGGRDILIFVDDFSTPRVSSAMQRVLNRLFLQRSPHYVAKLATEASSSFITEDSSGKSLQDGDDYQLVDMGEESLFLTDGERFSFLSNVFARRLAIDSRIPSKGKTLVGLLGKMPLSKTEFARKLRESPDKDDLDGDDQTLGTSQRRGRSRARVTYHGANVFSDLWSGDTRTMIQLVTDLVDKYSVETQHDEEEDGSVLPISEEIQDRVFRNRGGEWLESHSRNEPSNPKAVKEQTEFLQRKDPNFQLSGQYGEHLKAVVEAFVAAARHQLLGQPYIINEGSKERQVPRMAFRLEVTDEFRIKGLSKEIYRDLVRYGMFLRDSRGKSVQGAFVPRLYLRRLLLPYCALALSKRDSVSISCQSFNQLLLSPDKFRKEFLRRGRHQNVPEEQTSFPFVQDKIDPNYNDLAE